jgi:hypothetical protein
MLKIKSSLKIVIYFLLIGALFTFLSEFSFANPVIQPIGVDFIIYMILIYGTPVVFTIIVEFSIIYFLSSIVIEKEQKYNFLLIMIFINILTILIVQFGVFFISPFNLRIFLYGPTFLFRIIIFEITIIIIEFLVITFWLYQLYERFKLPNKPIIIFLWIALANVVSFVSGSLLSELLSRFLIKII